MARGISLSFLSDVSDFLRGTSSAEEGIADVGDSLDDLTRDAQRATDQVSTDLKSVGTAADSAAADLEGSFRQAFDDVGRHAQTMSDDVDRSVRDAGDHGKISAKEAGSEIGSEFAANIGEQIGSGQANIGDVVAGTLGGLVGIPGLGIAAAGIGIAGLFVKGVLGGIDAGKKAMAQQVQTAFDAIEIDPTGLTIKWDKAQLLQSAIDGLTEGGRTEDLQRVAEWVRAGIGEDTIAHALTGELTQADIDKLTQLASIRQTIKDTRGAERAIAAPEAAQAQELLDLAHKQNDAVRTANDLARISAGLTKEQADQQGRINTLIRERPIDPITNNRPGARWED